MKIVKECGEVVMLDMFSFTVNKDSHTHLRPCLHTHTQLEHNNHDYQKRYHGFDGITLNKWFCAGEGNTSTYGVHAIKWPDDGACLLIMIDGPRLSSLGQLYTFCQENFMTWWKQLVWLRSGATSGRDWQISVREIYARGSKHLNNNTKWQALTIS